LGKWVLGYSNSLADFSISFNAAGSSFDVANGGVMYKLLMRAFPG
jgi:hypothetical protein